MRAHHGTLEVVKAIDQPNAADDEFHPVLLDYLAANVDVTARERIHHLAQIDIGLPHLPGVHRHLILPDKAPDAGHLGHAFDGSKLVAEKEILQRAQRPEIKTTRGRIRAGSGALNRIGFEIILVNPA